MSEVIDITDLVEKARSTFVDYAVAFVYGEELIQIPALAPALSIPLIADIDRAILKMIFDALSKGIVMQAFFLNTAVRKAAQAKDFVDSVNALSAIPQGASNAEYLAAEKARMLAFAGFVSITN